MSTDTSPERSAKLFLRADHDFGTEQLRQRAVERLSALERDGTLAAFEIVVWGRELRLDGPLEGTDYYERIVSHVEAFEAWAARHDASLDPSFRRRTVESFFSDETYELVSLPVACLGIYRGDDLEQVYPCRRSDGPRSITDYLNRLESAGLPSAPP